MPVQKQLDRYQSGGGSKLHGSPGARSGAQSAVQRSSGKGYEQMVESAEAWDGPTSGDRSNNASADPTAPN